MKKLLTILIRLKQNPTKLDVLVDKMLLLFILIMWLLKLWFLL